jgi:hypothetical protein
MYDLPRAASVRFPDSLIAGGVRTAEAIMH